MQQYNYYSYLDYLSDERKEKINTDFNVDFEQFYEFYQNLVTYSKANNIDMIYLLENSHEIDKCIIYFELFDNLKQVAGNAVQGIKDAAGKFASFFKAFSINPVGVSNEFLKYLFNGLKNWSLIFNKINEFKAFVFKNIVSGTLKALIKDLLKIEDNVVPETFKQKLKQKLEEMKSQSAVKDAALKTFRIFLGGLVAFTMLNIWLISACSGFPGVDINIRGYLDLFDYGKSIFETLNIDSTVEMLFWYFLNSTQLATFLPQAYGALVANIQVVGFLFAIGFSIKMSIKYLPDSVKKTVCGTMGKMRNSLKIFLGGADIFKHIIHITESLGLISIKKNEKFCYIASENTETVKNAEDTNNDENNASQKTETETKNNSEGIIKDHYQDAMKNETIKKFLVKIESMSGQIKNKEGKPYALGATYGFQTMQKDIIKNNNDKEKDITEIITLSSDVKNILIELGYDKYKPINTFLKEHKEKLKEQDKTKEQDESEEQGKSLDKINWFYENKVANNFTLKRIFYN